MISLGSFFINSLYLLKYGPSATPHISTIRWLAGIFQETTSLLLLGYVLSRRHLRFKDLGFRWSWRDLGVGLLVAGISYAAYIGGALFVQVFHFAVYGTRAVGPNSNDFFAHPTLAIIPFMLLNPFFEELIVRAYLMTEILELTGSSALAVAVSVAVQFSYHLYYGWVGATTLAFVFLSFSFYYIRSRRALPIVVAHGFFDLLSMVRLLTR